MAGKVINMNKRFNLQLVYGRNPEVCDNLTFFPFMVGKYVDSYTDISLAKAKGEILRKVVFGEILEIDPVESTVKVHFQEEDFLVHVGKPSHRTYKAEMLIESEDGRIRISESCDLEIVE